jgi:hypothetical protein
MDLLTLPFTQKPAPKRGREEDLIVNYWRNQTPLKLRAPRFPACYVLSSIATGLGDTLMLTDLPRASAEQSKPPAPVFSTSTHFRPLMKFNPYWVEPSEMSQLILVNAPALVRDYNTGNGHYLQRLRRAFGYEVNDVPRACVAWKGQRHTHRVILHFDPGRHVYWQRANVHTRARALYSETRAHLEQFIHQRYDLEFILIGRAPDGIAIRGARAIGTPDLTVLINLMGSASWFIGIMSGPMHLAVALGLRCIVIVNFPPADQIVLPTLRQSHQVESEWMYPQNVHLHQEGESPLVPRANAMNLQRAFNNELYPYGKTDYCSLIHEKL